MYVCVYIYAFVLTYVHMQMYAYKQRYLNSICLSVLGDLLRDTALRQEAQPVGRSGTDRRAPTQLQGGIQKVDPPYTYIYVYVYMYVHAYWCIYTCIYVYIHIWLMNLHIMAMQP